MNQATTYLNNWKVPNVTLTLPGIDSVILSLYLSSDHITLRDSSRVKLSSLSISLSRFSLSLASPSPATDP